MAYVEFDETLPWCDWCGKPVASPVRVLRESSTLALFISAEGRVHIFKKKLKVPAVPDEEVVEPEISAEEVVPS